MSDEPLVGTGELKLKFEDVGRTVGWVYQLDLIAALDPDDWPLIVRLAVAAGADPARIAPLLALRLEDERRLSEKTGLRRV